MIQHSYYYEVRLDYVCPATYEEIDHETCKTFSQGIGCKELAQCKAYNEFAKNCKKQLCSDSPRSNNNSHLTVGNKEKILRVEDL